MGILEYFVKVKCFLPRQRGWGESDHKVIMGKEGLEQVDAFVPAAMVVEAVPEDGFLVAA